MSDEITSDSMCDGPLYDEYEESDIIDLPIEGLMLYRLAVSVDTLCISMAELYAEVITELDRWIGDPIEIWLEREIVLRGAHKLIGAYWAGLKMIPVVALPVENNDDAVEYAADECPTIMPRPRTGRPWTIAEACDYELIERIRAGEQIDASELGEAEG